MAPILDNHQCLQTDHQEVDNQPQNQPFFDQSQAYHLQESPMEPKSANMLPDSPSHSSSEDSLTDSPSGNERESSESEMSSAAALQESDGERSKKKPCTVCGEPTRGVYYGAVACLPCKTFFVRYSGEKRPMKCRTGKRNCEINEATRVSCKACRYSKCIRVGMRRKERPVRQLPCEGQQLCAVCRDVANGLHFGVFTCEGCKKFFRRGLDEHATYTCKFGNRCMMNPRTRNLCRYCRFQRCIEVGMSLEGIRFGRRKKDKDEEGYILLTGQEGMEIAQCQPEAMQRCCHQELAQKAVQQNQNSACPVAVSTDLQTLYAPIQTETSENDMVEMNNVHRNEFFQSPLYNGQLQPYAVPDLRKDCPPAGGQNCSHPVGHPPAENTQMPTHMNGFQRSGGDSQPKHGERSVNFRPQPEVIRYWQNSVPLEVSLLTQDEKGLINTTLELYQPQKLYFTRDPQSPTITTLTALLALGDKGVDEGMLQNISNFVTFAKSLPGFGSIRQPDQCALIRSGSLETRILSSALFDSLSLDDKMQEAFIARNPTHLKFLKTTLNISKTIRLLNLDEIETCLLTVLCLIASDRPGLQYVDAIEEVRKKYISVMASYIEDNHGDAFSRLSAIFSVMPRVRQIGQWYYELSGNIPVYLPDSSTTS